VTEPTAVAERVEIVVPGVLHWTVRDERINFRGDAYAVRSAEGQVLVDPLPILSEVLESLGQVVAICVTAGQHQRSAWRLRRELGVPIHAPEGTPDLEEEPDVRFGDDVLLPGNLRALSTPGTGTGHHILVLDGLEAGRVLFSGDLVMRETDGPFFLIPDYYVEDPVQVRASVRKAIELAPAVLCPSHGAPQVGGGEQALREALQRASSG
jgi:glyoxylase-like metal-dependent hydrolase (beta-lactamase superfamily II)